MLVAVSLLLVLSGYGQTAQDREIAGITERIGKTLVAKQKTKLAVTDFADLQGRPTDFGRFLAEQLSVEFVNAPGISVVDRANLKSILAEHKLSEEGLVNPEAAKKLGQFAGVDVIVIGTIAEVQEGLVVTVKAIATDTAEIVAAAKTVLQKNNLTSTQGAPSKESAPEKAANKPEILLPRPVNDGSLASRDLDDIYMALVSVSATRITDSNRTVLDAIRCVFEFTNRNPQKTFYIGMNGDPESTANQNGYYGRSKIIDPGGNVYVVSDVTGMQIITVGPNGHPLDIANVIKREAVASVRTWRGTLKAIKPGTSITVSVTYGPKPNLRYPHLVHGALEFEAEIISGWAEAIIEPGTERKMIDPVKSAFSLKTIIWRNVPLR